MRWIAWLLFLQITALDSYSQPSQITAVENGLIPYVPVYGFATWNIEDRMRHYNIPGASIAVIRNFKVDWAKSYGFADTIRKSPATNQTMFSAGSISKFVTAVIALKLVERDRLSLDSPINKYLSTWKLEENEFTAKRPVTLRMLLSHTGGTSQSAYFGYIPSKNPLPGIVQILSGDSLAEVNRVVVNSEPAKEFRYSGGGYMIIQLAIMDVLKKDFNAIAQEEIFQPLSMHNSTFMQPLPTSFANRAAWGYSSAPWYKGVPYVYPQQAAAGLYSTPTDLSQLLIELQKCYDNKGRLLKKSTVKEMLTPVTTITKGAYIEQMGLGAFLLEREGNIALNGKYFEHQGVNAGFTSLAMASLTGGNGVVIMLNSGDDFSGFGTELRRSVANVYHWNNFLPPAIKPIKFDDKTMMNYVGRYRKGTDEVITIRREKDYLVETINEGRDIYCFLVGVDSIVFTDFNVKGFFKRDSSGKVISIRTEYQSEKDAMPKMNDAEFTPSENLRLKKYTEAKQGFVRMGLNEYQITYLAYEWLNKRPFDSLAVKTILEVASEQHPASPIVNSRWGDYYQKLGDKENAARSYNKSLQQLSNTNE